MPRRSPRNETITLSASDVEFLNGVIEKKSNKESIRIKARVLLGLQDYRTKTELSKKLGVQRERLYTIQKQFEEMGINCVFGKKGNMSSTAFNKEQREKIVSLAKNTPQQKLSCRFLAKRAIELGYVEYMTHEAARKILMDSGICLCDKKVVTEQCVDTLLKLSKTAPPKPLKKWLLTTLVAHAISEGIIPQVSIETVRRYIVRNGNIFRRK